jgi:hypothetical protein
VPCRHQDQQMAGERKLAAASFHRRVIAVHETTRRFWAVTCYFNPCGYRRRALNYRIFRQRLRVPLLTVELSFDGRFALDERDADKLIRLRAADVMWQKERLLNVAIRALPRECDRVAWIDCDIVFEEDDWPARANAALDRHVVIQPFDISKELLPDAVVEGVDLSRTYLTCRSLACGLAIGEVEPGIMLAPDKRGLGSMDGLAWAAHRDLLERHGLYDACVIGGGDGAIAAGVVGNFQDFIDYLLLNPRRSEHFLDWARPFYDTVHADFGCCQGTIYHLWHGDLKDRNYRERRVGFAKFDFDPHTDIAIGGSGAWQWSSDKPLMHRFVRDYFDSRFEDGRPDGMPAHSARGAG